MEYDRHHLGIARVPGNLDATGYSGEMRPLGQVRFPLQGSGAAEPLNQSKPLLELIEPRPVRADARRGAKRYRCSHSVYDSSVDHFEIRQGGVLNCPLPAFLAAMWITKTFSKYISVKEIKREAVSSQGTRRIKVDRYFEVAFPGKKFFVSDFFWGSAACRKAYADSSKDALWVSLIEKAYVRYRSSNSYENLSDAGRAPDANQVIEDLAGVEYANADLISGLSDQQLRDRINQAATTPTITNLPAPNSNQAHAYALEGFDPAIKNEVLLFDSLGGKSLSLSYESFKKEYQYLLYP